MTTIVYCPKCSARFQLPPVCKDAVCPRCRTPVSAWVARAAQEAPLESQQASATPPAASKTAAPVAPPPTSATPTVKKLGFVTYSRRHFAATHWPGAFGICCGLVSIPIVSLLKPILGYRGMCTVLAGAVALSIVGGAVYMIGRFTDYFVRGARTVPIHASSWMARLAYGGLMFLVPMAPWVAAEYFAPADGLLASILPYVREEQARWLRLSIPETENHDSDTATSSDKDVRKTEEPSTTRTPPQPPAESENPFTVVEDLPAANQSPKDKAPRAADNADDDNPFQVIEKGSR